MAPKEEFYFPALEQCLSGRTTLISWSDVFALLCDPSPMQHDSKVFKFLSSDEALRALALSTSKDNPKPSATTKSDFETRTAAINITPASHGQYDIEQIKTDAIWLSKEVNLSEVSALRLVILEWQHRPKTKLRSGFTEVELASLQKATGSALARNAGLLGRECVVIDAPTASYDGAARFLSDERRRLRIFDEYLLEKRSILAVHENLLAAFFSLRDVQVEDLFAISDQPIEQISPKGALGRRILEMQQKAGVHDSVQQIRKCIESLQICVDQLAEGSGAFKAEGGRADIEDASTRINLQCMMNLMNIMFLHIRSCKRILPSDVVLAWYHLAENYDFLERFEASSEYQLTLLPGLRAGVVSVSLSILQFSKCFAFLRDATDRNREELEPRTAAVYFFDKSAVPEIHNVLSTAATTPIPIASPAILSWGILLDIIHEEGRTAKEIRENNQLQKGPALLGGPGLSRRDSGSSVSSSQQSIFEEIFDAVRQSQDDDPVGLLLYSALEQNSVFEIISTAAAIAGSKTTILSTEKQLMFLELLSGSLNVAHYSPQVVSCLLELLNNTDSPQHIVANAFSRDKCLMDAVFDESLSRFPYESLPFLQLCAALSPVLDASGVPFVLSRLRNMTTFTQPNSPNFNGYHTILEDQNANLVKLDQPLSMYQQSSRMLTDKSFEATKTLIDHDDFLIKVGTEGQVISDTRPSVIMWYHRYSGLQFLGKFLSLIKRGKKVSFADVDDNGVAVIAATVTLLSRLLSACLGTQKRMSSTSAVDEAKSILDETGDSLDESEDVISLIFNIFEQELNDLQFQANKERDLTILVACVEFFQSVIHVRPGRVWPFLARSSFLDTTVDGGLLGSIIASVESSTGYYFFLQRCVELYSSLIDEAVSTLTSFNGPELATRSSARNNLSLATPSHIVGRVLSAMTQSIMGVFDIATESRFLISQQQAEINESICSAFSKIVEFAYFVDEQPNLSKKLTSTLFPSAPTIIEALKPETLVGTLAEPLLRTLARGCNLPDPSLDLTNYEAHVNQVASCLEFCIKAIRASRSVADSLKGFETQLLNALPIFPRLVAEVQRLVTPALTMIDCLLEAQPQQETSAASLLSQLGSESSRNFLSLLGRYDRTDEGFQACCATWRLLSTLVGNRQQWFSVFILTGSSPKESIKAKSRDKGDSETIDGGNKSFLDSALHLLYQIEELDPELSLCLLRFVAKAIENWSWATANVRNQSGFLPSLYSYVSKIGVKSDNSKEQCYEIQNAAVIADILTVYFHHMRAGVNDDFLNKAISSIIWYTQHASDVSAYRESLHYNLSQNLKRKFPGCQLSHFKKTTAASRELGEEFCYDVNVVRATLKNDAKWLGNERTGFEHEVRLANVNLSMVESQLSLLSSWRTLAVEHGSLLLRNSELQEPLTVAASKCLQANTIPIPQEAIFDKVYQIRADLCLALLQRLAVANCKGLEAEALLAKAWDAMNFRTTSFEIALANDDLAYWRTLVEILFLTLQLICQNKQADADDKPPPRSSTTLPTVLEILTVIVAQGFRGLTSVLHDEQALPDTVTPKDFALILGVLQACLRVPSLLRITAEISEHVISTDVAKYALLLYSWSHTLTPKTGHQSAPDPVYGEISLLFLVSLSKIPLLAEDLATSSILSQILSTHVSQLLANRGQGASPFEVKSLLARRLYSIWSGGILPLCLNLLTHVGRGFAAEIAAFLKQFPAQLQNASLSFASSAVISSSADPVTGAISLSMAHEISILTLIALVLDAYRTAGPSAGVDALEIPELEFWDAKARKELREDLEYLLERRAILRKRITPTSAKETEMSRGKPTRQGQGYENLLEQTVVEELKGVLACLKGKEDI